MKKPRPKEKKELVTQEDNGTARLQLTFPDTCMHLTHRVLTISQVLLQVPGKEHEDKAPAFQSLPFSGHRLQ